MTKSTSTQTKTIKVEIFEGNRCTISLHNIKPYDRKKFDYTKCDNYGTFMTSKSYGLTRKKRQKELWNMDFNLENSYFITLTFKEMIHYKDIMPEFNKIKIYLTRAFGHFEFFRAFELTKKHNYHIHIVAQFDMFPFGLCKKSVEYLWKLGICHVKPITNMNDFRGAIQYLTKHKKNNINLDNPRLTHFPRSAKIFGKSLNFGKSISIKTSKKICTTNDKIKSLLDYLKARNDENFTRIDGHNYFDKNGNRYYCKDKLYIRGLDIEDILKMLA
ncbi:MAG: hypothetical protein K2L12_03115 [Clostridia bacterium]|nr:hypothetical protein [Clostridia bacterium]